MEIVFSVNGDEHTAEVSAITWPRSLVGDAYLVVEHPSTSYVVAITWDGFVAYPIGEEA